MIKSEQIPDKVVEAAARAILESLRTARLTTEGEDGYRPEARAAIAAALNAWPGVIEAHHPRDNQHALILPLPEAPEGRIAKQEEPRHD